MADLIKTITDKDQFEHIFNSYFSKGDIYLKTSGGNIKLQYLGYSEGHVAFRIPRVKNLPEMVVVFTRYRTSTIYAALRSFESNEDTFVLIPVKIQILAEARKEDRQVLGDDRGTSVLYITAVLSDFIIERALAMEEKKIDKITEIATFDLKKQFDRIRIHFINRGKSDIRLQHVSETYQPIFISDLNTPAPSSEKEQMYNHYINEIYTKDVGLSRSNQFISEVTVPICFRNMLVYGFIQVNNKTPMTDGHLQVVRRMAVVVNELCRKHEVFYPTNEKFLVSDISRNGIGVVFRERRAIRFFQQDSLISFETILPTQKKAVIGARVRNITFLDNGVIKAGSEIVLMDRNSRANFDEFIEEASARKAQAEPQVQNQPVQQPENPSEGEVAEPEPLQDLGEDSTGEKDML